MIKLDSKNSNGQNVLLEPNSLPPDIIAAVKALPWDGKGLIAGIDSQTLPFIKQRRLDIAQGAKFTFVVNDLRIDKIFIVAEEIYIQGPNDLNQVSEISYKLTAPLDGQKPPKGNGGVDHRTEQSGANGGNGETGRPGGHGTTYSAPSFFLFFQKIQIVRPNPSVSTLLKFNFPGMFGASGGDGGDAGWGAKGTHAEDNKVLGKAVSCKAGPGVGGSSGVPGSGGRGGNAANGGDGSTIVICGPQSESIHISFTADTKGGKKGFPGSPGKPGSEGEPGSGGDLSEKCRDGRPGGYKHSANPIDLGPGDHAEDGRDGSYHVEYRDNSDLFATFP
jgi:hypothetical protein